MLWKKIHSQVESLQSVWTPANSKKIKSLMIGSLALVLSACGSSNGQSTTTTIPTGGGGGGVNPFNNYCPPGAEWMCAYTGNSIFQTGTGYYFGDTLKLGPNQSPNPGQFNVGFNGQNTVANGNKLRLSGNARWGEVDLDFWDYFFGGFFTDLDDYCDLYSNKKAKVNVAFGTNLPINISDAPGQEIVVTNTPIPSGVYYGYDPVSKPGGADCLFVNSLRLDKIF